MEAPDDPRFTIHISGPKPTQISNYDIILAVKMVAVLVVLLRRVATQRPT